ncbi:MAG: reverse transcriptase/maturase family protein [Pseudomonadota bacterium]
MSKKSAYLFVSNPQNVEKHSFFPFIEFDISTRRYRTEYVMIDGKKLKRRKISEPKIRPIKLSSHKDGYIYAYYGKMLSNLYENYVKNKDFSQNVIAYRPKMGTNYSNAVSAFDFILEVGPSRIYTLDISSFFENIDHRVLKENWKTILGSDHLPDDHYKIFRSLTKNSKIRLESLTKILNLEMDDVLRGKVGRLCSPSEFREKIRNSEPNVMVSNYNGFGIPQGSAMSSVLSNIYMINFDIEMSRFCSINGIFYRRYCDDIIFVQKNESGIDIIDEVKKNLTLAGDRLQIKDEKTGRYFFDGLKVHNGPVQYLGLTFDGKNIRIRNTSLAKFHRKMRAAVGYRKFKAHKRVGELNGVLLLRSLYRKYSWKKDSMSFHGYVGKVHASTTLSSVKEQTRKNQKQLEKLIKS